MLELLLHPTVTSAVDAYTATPSQAMVIIGPPGIGKGSITRLIAATLLHTTHEAVMEDARVLTLGAEGKIGIDEVRKIQHFLALKPADPSHATRIVCIENAERLPIEAQNALLKSIEEPPAECYVILSTTSPHQLLPTIMSRVQTLMVTKPEQASLKQYFAQQGHSAAKVDRAYVMSGGLPGTMTELLAENAEHPVLQAADGARQMLQASKFERLVLIDKLAKDREAAINTCEMLCKMATISLAKDGLAKNQQERWRAVLAGGLETIDILRQNGQAKLALTALSLKI